LFFRFCLFSVVTPMALTGCTAPLSMLDPAGPAAGHIATLWWVMASGALAIFVFVMGLLFAAFRHPGLDEPPRQGQERRLERLWIRSLGIAFPLTVLAALLGYGLVVGEALLPRAAADVLTVRAHAQQWTWRFSYAGEGGAETINVMNIPAGRPVDIEITSADVIHSFWVPRLAGKLDAIPGQVNTLRIEASEPGRYEGVSSEFSGAGYAGHRFTVIVHDKAGWAAFLEQAGAP
jgi:cytochrome c oxidase subunit II